MAEIVPIDRVTIGQTSEIPTSNFFVRKMMTVLRKQGQIEPLQVTQEYKTFPQDVYGEEILLAAKALGWDTLLVVVMRRYEY